MDERDIYKELLSLQQKLHEDQMENIRRKTGELTVQVEVLVRSLQDIAVEQAKIEQHVESRNGDHIHHISPCSRLTEVIDKVTELKKECEICKNKVSSDFRNIDMAIEQSRKAIESNMTAIITKGLSDHQTNHISIFKIVLSIIGTILTMTGVVVGAIKLFF